MRTLFDVGVTASNLNDNEQEDTVSKANDVDKISYDLTDCFDGEKIETFEDNEDDSNGIETVSLSASNCGQRLAGLESNKQTLFCFPCRLFYGNISKSSVTERSLSSRSVLASPGGYAATGKWQKLCNRIPEHERSNVHRKCYLDWRELERRFLSGKGIETYLESSIKLQSTKWSNILKRILDVILFLGEGGLAFWGSSQRIGNVDNGNCLGLIELLSHWDPILKKHVLSVEESQQKGKRLQVHYLSADTQNEFIAECSGLV
ncbi:uncharacterized protein LOC136087888 [Hydra vulgaris]|uniref:Uncharacterized protein LOC136087888 n=1 Tax=Hydra vulgaris TaxID=6087 RepID=A0ABM4D019_HYDVU